jgi:ribosomal protein S8E
MDAPTGAQRGGERRVIGYAQVASKPDEAGVENHEKPGLRSK